MSSNYEFKPIPDYGDKMTIEEFREQIKLEALIDTDGIGYLATKTQVTEISVHPSTFHKISLLNYSELTHIVWFNK